MECGTRWDKIIQARSFELIQGIQFCKDYKYLYLDWNRLENITKKQQVEGYWQSNFIVVVG